MIILLHFHSELNIGGDAINMVKEIDQRGMAMRPNEKGFIYKSKLTCGFKMKVI
jgi:hypothetical protein